LRSKKSHLKRKTGGKKAGGARIEQKHKEEGGKRRSYRYCLRKEGLTVRKDLADEKPVEKKTHDLV